ncbi:DEAD/DEAH box helicase [Rheinheimera sp. SA_1]|uniref:TonB-dependent receptor n=1 Tax=Rheinheimera sp. SA_1 TaxID=1827365 RepID=UPI0007FD15AE|nr:TonB-dependent receptor [Rheinheimera sp. SA_1]OBP13688.1 DEAD/DEAH box helicase [Rheinheimera sp. SA_1]
MKHYKLNLLTLALATAGFSAYSAADQQAETTKPQASEELEVIEIRGIRRSLLGSLDKKRFNDTVSEVVDAGDLGSLPDISIADALGRLPGVTTVRDSGQSSQLNIRGMNGDFIQTTLNGREQASTSGYTAGSRWIAFDQYPSELINQAALYKSPKASLVEGGVAGTVEMRTVNPLDAKEQHNFSGSVRFSHNDAASDVDADPNGERVSFAYQGKYLEDTLGVALGVAHLEQPNSSYQVSTRAYAAARDVNGDGKTEKITDGFQTRFSKGSDSRLGVLGSLVYQPNDQFSAKLDYFKSDFESEDKKNGINIEGMNRDANTYSLTNPTVQDGYVTGGTVNLTGLTGPWIEMRTEDQSTKSDTESTGLSLDWKQERWSIHADVAHSEGNKTRLDRIASMHSYQFGPRTLGDNTVVQGWNEKSGQSFTFMNQAGGFPAININTDLTDLSAMRLGIWEQFPHQYSDEIDSAKVDFKYELEGDVITSVESGVRLSDRTFADQRSTFRWGRREGQNGYVSSNGSVVNVEGCEFNKYNHPCRPAELTNFVTVKSAKGMSYLDLDLLGIADSVFGKGNYEAQQTWDHNWTLIESGSVEEKVSAAYLMANLDTEIFDHKLTGNVGVRYVKTDTKSIGIQQVREGEGDTIVDDNGVARTDYKHIKYGPEYNDVLPSLNLNFAINEDEQLRFAASKVIGRPPVYQLRGGAGSWIDTANDGVSPRYNVWSKGNPNLDPFRATQLDLSYERYMGKEGAFTAAIFWKDIESLIESVTFNEGDISWAEIGLTAPPGTVEGQYQTTRNNNKGGYIRGAELAYTTVFSDLPGIFSTLGMNASYSYTESETSVDGGSNFGSVQLPLPGLSKNVWSTTVFWEVGQISTHINARYRDEYVYAGATPGGSSFQWADEYIVVDWQVSYDFENGLVGVAQVNNLTNEPNIGHYGNQMLNGEYSEFGRQMYLGVNFSF